MSLARRGRRAARDLAGALTATPAFAAAVALAERLRRPRPGALAVLMYHRVAGPGERPDLDPALVSATPEGFGRQMEHLAASGRAVALDHVLAGPRELPPGAVLVTFDDAYEDFARHAWPVLAELGIPATMFVATAYPDRPERGFWWDRLHRALAPDAAAGRVDTPVGSFALRTQEDRVQVTAVLRERLAALPHADALAIVAQLERERSRSELDRGSAESSPSVLSWNTLRALAAAGLAIGAHTDTHPLLDRVPPAEAEAELERSRDALARELGERPRAIAYPGGACTAHVVERARATGFELGFTTRRGVNDLRGADLLRLDRINVGLRASPAAVRAQLLARPAGGR